MRTYRTRGTGTVAKLKLLIIEDDADQRELIKETLEEHFGAGTVAEAANAREGLAHDLGSFDLILADYNLPDGTGMELLEKIGQPLPHPGHHGHRRKRRLHRRRSHPQGRHRLRREVRRLSADDSAGRREEPDRRPK